MHSGISKMNAYNCDSSCSTLHDHWQHKTDWVQGWQKRITAQVYADISNISEKEPDDNKSILKGSDIGIL